MRPTRARRAARAAASGRRGQNTAPHAAGVLPLLLSLCCCLMSCQMLISPRVPVDGFCCVGRSIRATISVPLSSRIHPAKCELSDDSSCEVCAAGDSHCRPHRCVARLDHHCAWLNNCVGFNNMRYFLLFLAANLLLAVYGVVSPPSVAVPLTAPRILPLELGALYTRVSCFDALFAASSA